MHRCCHQGHQTGLKTKVSEWCCGLKVKSPGQTSKRLSCLPLSYFTVNSLIRSAEHLRDTIPASRRKSEWARHPEKRATPGERNTGQAYRSGTRCSAAQKKKWSSKTTLVMTQKNALKNGVKRRAPRLRRWLSMEEHLLLLQRTQVQAQSTHGCLKLCNYSSWGSGALFWALQAPDIQPVHFHTHRQNIYIKCVFKPGGGGTCL